MWAGLGPSMKLELSNLGMFLSRPESTIFSCH
jgi:hypothetical protein